MKSKFIKSKSIADYFHKTNPGLRLTPGFLAFLDVHMRSVLARAGTQRQKGYLDANAALVACRYPFHVEVSRMEVTP